MSDKLFKVLLMFKNYFKIMMPAEFQEAFNKSVRKSNSDEKDYEKESSKIDQNESDENKFHEE